MIKRITTPASDEQISQLQAGDMVELTGVLFTGRDAAHKRMLEYINNALDKGQEPRDSLPIDLKNQGIYYTGPFLLRQVK